MTNKEMRKEQAYIRRYGKKVEEERFGLVLTSPESIVVKEEALELETTTDDLLEILLGH
jgi:hypothetical protein